MKEEQKQKLEKAAKKIKEKGMLKFRAKVFWVTELVLLFTLIEGVVFDYIIDSALVDVSPFMYHMPRAMMYILLIGLPIITVISLILARFVRPLEKVCNALYRGETVDRESYFKARKVLIRLSGRIILANIVTYLIVFILAVTERPAFYLSFSGIVSAVSFISGAIVFALIQINIHYYTLKEARTVLDIQQLDKGRREKEMSLKTRLLLTTLSLLFFGACIMYESNERLITVNTIYSQVLPELKGDLSLLDSIQDGIITKLEANRFPLDPDYRFHPDSSMIKTADFYQINGFSILYIAMIGAALSILTTWAIAGQIRNLRDKMLAIADGGADLDETVSITLFDDIGELTSAINKFIGNQRNLFAEIKASGESLSHVNGTLTASVNNTVEAIMKLDTEISNVDSIAREKSSSVSQTGVQMEELLASLESITDNVESQAAYVQQTSSAMTQMAASIESVFNATGKAEAVSNELSDVAEQGRNALEQNLNGMNELEKSSRQVGEAVTVVAEIADTTNLLSMNAAIEAAHAGEAGKGFAVVADEVRKLANTSAVNTGNINDRIQGMLEQMKLELENTALTNQSFENIVQGVQNTGKLINEINMAMQEQNAGTTQILSAMNSLVESNEMILQTSRAQKEQSIQMREAMASLINSFEQINRGVEVQNEEKEHLLIMTGELENVVHESSQVAKTLERLLKG